jgi:recombination protein RecR
MNDYIEKLAELFKQFPGIGERQAKRFVYFLLSKDRGYIGSLSDGIMELKKHARQCIECFRFFTDDGHELCDICSSAKRKNDTLMIVEKDADVTSLERSRVFTGKYFVFGGTVPVILKDTPKNVRIGELLKRIKNETETLKEIILGFSLTPQGDHTDTYIREEINRAFPTLSIKISSLGRGLSTGTELEYSDKETLKSALENRQ